MFLKNMKKDSCLYLSVIILLLLYVLSFTRSCSSSKKRQEVKTALVNPKNIELITGFNIFNSTSLISLNKHGNIWTVSQGDSEYMLPVSGEKMKNMLNNLTSIRNMYKLSDKIERNNSFGLTDSSAIHLMYTYPDGIHQLSFGNYDFSQNYRYMMTDRNTAVYEVSTSLDPYLQTSVQSWSEPFLISQEVLGHLHPEDIQNTSFINDNKTKTVSDISKLLELRHGGLGTKPEIEIPEARLILEIGNKNQIQLEFYPVKDNSEYIVKSSYFNFKNRENQIFYSKISSWTYSKINEITL